MLGHPKLDSEEIEFLIQQNAVFNTEYKRISTGELYSYRKTGVPVRKINGVLLHGNLVSSINMESIMYKLELKGKFVAPCLRGYGFSSLNNPVKSFDDLADDVYAFMEEAFPEIDDYYVFGHDTGAIVGMKLAIKHPEKVRGLTLLSPIPPTGLKDDIPVNSIEDLKKFKQKSYLYGMIQNRDKAKYKTMLDYYHIEGEPERDVAQQLFTMKMQRHYWEMEFLQYTLNMSDEELKRIQCPVKLMYGLNDTRQTAEDGLFLKNKFGKQCDLAGIQDSGHFAHMDQPGNVSGGFFSFIKKTDNNKKWQVQLKAIQEENKVKEKAKADALALEEAQR